MICNFVFIFFFFFFFQAEDGIRDRNVTGVQTCALPISVQVDKMAIRRAALTKRIGDFQSMKPAIRNIEPLGDKDPAEGTRSEERRVGKECRYGRARYQ